MAEIVEGGAISPSRREQSAFISLSLTVRLLVEKEKPGGRNLRRLFVRLHAGRIMAFSLTLLIGAEYH